MRTQVTRVARDSGARFGANHTFRDKGIAACLKNSGKLEVAQHIANHGSPRTRKLYL